MNNFANYIQHFCITFVAVSKVRNSNSNFPPEIFRDTNYIRKDLRVILVKLKDELQWSFYLKIKIAVKLDYNELGYKKHSIIANK